MGRRTIPICACVWDSILCGVAGGWDEGVLKGDGGFDDARVNVDKFAGELGGIGGA